MVEHTTRLTPREWEVLERIALGRHFFEVAEDLIISPHTVHTHATNIRQKLGARNVVQAVYLAMVCTGEQVSA